MKRSVITGALVLIILGASATTGHAAYKSFPSYIYSINANKNAVEIISPKGDIIVQDSLLISVQVREDVSVTLSVYKEKQEKEQEDTLIFGPEKVEPGESLKFYTKKINDLTPGKYRMVFDVKDKDGNKQKPMIKYFTVKDKEDELNESLDNITKKSVTNIIQDTLVKKEK